MEMFDLTGKGAVITGAASGIGRAIALGFARAGAHLMVTDVNAQGLEETLREIQAQGRRAGSFVADVTDGEAVDSLMNAARDFLGSVDVLVNSAGLNIRKPALELSLEEYQYILQVNLVGVFRCCRAAGRIMVEQRRGSIINLSSIMGHVAMYNISAYASSKGGVSQLTRALAIEWAPYNVRVNAICPGYVRTPLTRAIQEDPQFVAFVEGRTPLGRLAEPQEIVGPAIFLASDASRYVTGTSLFVDGGWTSW